MKIYNVYILFILFLSFIYGCGKEEFAGVPQSTNETASPLKSFSANSCSTYTLIKPKVDILYIIDNSSSTYYLSSEIKSGISKTINTLSNDFDYRFVGTSLLESAEGNQNYQVMTNSPDLNGIPGDSRLLTSAAGFDFFTKPPISGVERGLNRTIEFIGAHKNSLFRKDSYLIVVLVSNGRDEDVETDRGFGNGETILNTTNFNSRLTSLRNLKLEMNSIQLRLFAVTAKSVCYPGWRSSNQSYIKMASQLYADSMATDNPLLDSYDLCTNSVSSIFSSINQSIKQVMLPHQYRYAPVTFAENNESVSIDELKVQRISPNGTSVILNKNVDWTYDDRGVVQSVNLREGPNPTPGPGEPVNGRHFIKLNQLLIYPDCILVTSVSRTEYFNYIVLPQKPQPGLSVRINGQLIPESHTNGWSNETSVVQTLNIKAPHPQPGDQNPPLMKTGFMLKLNGVNNYYKSGDNVQVNFVPAGI